MLMSRQANVRFSLKHYISYELIMTLGWEGVNPFESPVVTRKESKNTCLLEEDLRLVNVYIHLFLLSSRYITLLCI